MNTKPISRFICANPQGPGYCVFEELALLAANGVTILESTQKYHGPFNTLAEAKQFFEETERENALRQYSETA